MMNEIQMKAWKRLSNGKDLNGFDLEKFGGRVDLRDLHVAEPYVIENTRKELADIALMGGVTTIRGAKWQSIDFSKSHLAGLRIFNSDIKDCLFENCKMHDLRIWNTRFSDVSFRSANLRGAVLGGVENTERNVYRNVDFTSADLRGTVYKATEFIGCIFKNTRLDKVDFQSSTFVDCIFEGELREVIFYRTGFKGEHFPENKMINVDMRRAKLRWTAFRGLNLENMRFPEDDAHIIFRDVTEVIEKLLSAFRLSSNPRSKGVVGLLENYKKWIGPKQKLGLFNKEDIRDIAGEEGLALFISTLGESQN